MERFWEHSWKRVDPERVAGYVQSIDMNPDPLIDALHRHGVKTVCDAGCGCGAYAMKLAANGFSVCGFDVSSHAVEIAQTLLEKAALAAELKTAGILSTGYADGTFDGVVCRDVLDHLPRAEAAAAVKELCRITKPGGHRDLHAGPAGRRIPDGTAPCKRGRRLRVYRREMEGDGVPSVYGGNGARHRPGGDKV